MGHCCNAIFYLTLFFSYCICNGQTSNYESKLKVNIDSICTHILKDSVLVTGWYYVSDSVTGFKRQLYKSKEFYFLDPRPIVVKENFVKLKPFTHKYKGVHYTGLSIKLDEVGTELWAIATRKAIGKKLGFICDNKLFIAPMVNAHIINGTTPINCECNKSEVEQLKKSISSVAFSQSNYKEAKKPKKNSDFVTFVAELDIADATKDGIYFKDYVVNINYEDAEKLNGKTIGISGKVTIIKGLKNQPKLYSEEGYELSCQGREENIKYIESPKIELIEKP